MDRGDGFDKLSQRVRSFYTVLEIYIFSRRSNSRTSVNEFQIKAFPFQSQSIPVLGVEQWLFHNGAKDFYERDTVFSEIPALVRRIPFLFDKGQSYYNRSFAFAF
jgi:hypothetical protein